MRKMHGQTTLNNHFGRSTRNIGGARALKRGLNSVMDKRGDKITETARGS